VSWSARYTRLHRSEIVKDANTKPIDSMALTDGALHARHVQVITDKLPSPLTFHPSEGGPVHVRRSDHFRMSIGQQNHFRACMLALQHGLLGTIGKTESRKRIAGFFTANRSRSASGSITSLLPVGSRNPLAVASLIGFCFFSSAG